MGGRRRKLSLVHTKGNSSVTRRLQIGLVLLALMTGASCERLREDAEIVSHDEAVRAVQEESDRRRPGYREVVVEEYAVIVEKRKAEWAEERAREREVRT